VGFPPSVRAGRAEEALLLFARTCRTFSPLELTDHPGPEKHRNKKSRARSQNTPDRDVLNTRRARTTRSTELQIVQHGLAPERCRPRYFF